MIRTVGRDMNRHQALPTHNSSLATIFRLIRVIFTTQDSACYFSKTRSLDSAHL